jgi:DNA-binding GntR family transcriptional regulator
MMTDLPVVAVAKGHPLGTGKTVLYRALADELREAITSGAIAPGGRLPTEYALCARRGVSRHTAREAIRILRQEGLIISRRGAGTVVAAQAQNQRLSQTISGVGDLLQYETNTILDVNLRVLVDPDGHEAQVLGLPSTRKWVRIDAVRRGPNQAIPIALTQIFLRVELCPPTPEIDSWRGALHDLIASRSGIRAVRIDQQITAVCLARMEARRLDVAPASAALKTTRRFYDHGGELYQASISLHPGSRFVYDMVLAADGQTIRGD